MKHPTLRGDELIRRRPSFQIIRDVLALNSENPPLTRRWEVAVAIAYGMARRRLFKKQIDADVESAIEYVKRRDGDRLDRQGPLADLDQACCLRYQADLLTRSTLEARLLSGQTIAETAVAPKGTAPGNNLPAVPGYRVLREIARGGMGRVLAAHDNNLDREVALKILLPGANADRFVRESKITARLPHPGIPPVHALGTLTDGSPFLAMKLIVGQTLAVEMKSADRPRLLQAFRACARRSVSPTVEASSTET